MDRVKESKYDVIFTDYEMPVLDGIEATRKIRKFDKQTPIYMNSGSREEGLRKKAIEAGVTDFATKDDIIMKGLDYFGDILKDHHVLDE